MNAPLPDPARRPVSGNTAPSRAILSPRLLRESDRLQRELERADADPLARSARLREFLPAEEARAAAELLTARQRARGKLPQPELWWLTRRGLEQASHGVVATWRAAWIRERIAGGELLRDGTCGVGMDALALLRAGVRVVAGDRDPIVAALADRNLRAHGFRGRVICAAATRPVVEAPFALFDPDRRSEESGATRRHADPRFGSPGLAELVALSEGLRGACWKLAPGVFVDELPGVAGLGAEWMALGRGREVAETTVFTGELAQAPGRRTAVVLRGEVESRFEGAGPDPDLPPLGAGELDDLRTLAIPHPTLVAARLLGQAAEPLGLRPLGPGLAWFGAVDPPAGDHPGSLWRVHRVLEACPADGKRIRALLRRHGIGPLRVQTRGSALSAAELEKRFGGAKGKNGTLLVARTTRGQRAHLVEESEAPEGP